MKAAEKEEIDHQSKIAKETKAKLEKEKAEYQK